MVEHKKQIPKAQGAYKPGVNSIKRDPESKINEMRYKMPKCSSSCEKCVLERLIACLEHCHTQQTTSIPLKGLSQLLRTDSAIQTTAHAPQLPPSANSCTCANCHPPQPRCNVQVIEISSCGSIICENAKNAPGRYGPSIARFLLVSR